MSRRTKRNGTMESVWLRRWQQVFLRRDKECAEKILLPGFLSLFYKRERTLGRAAFRLAECAYTLAFDRVARMETLSPHDKNSCALSDASECTSDGSAILSMTKRMDNSKRCSRSKMMMTKERTCC